jgi:hypothetical protein
LHLFGEHFIAKFQTFATLKLSVHRLAFHAWMISVNSVEHVFFWKLEAI